MFTINLILRINPIAAKPLKFKNQISKWKMDLKKKKQNLPQRSQRI